MPKKSARREPQERRSFFPIAALAVALVLAGGFLAWRFYGPGSQPPAPTARDDQQIFAQYAGSQTCRECHAEVYNEWKNSHHGLAERPFDPSIDAAAFDPAQIIEHGTQTTEARRRGDVYEIVTAGADGRERAFPAERVIGVDPLRQFLVPAEGGRFQATELAVDVHRGDWFNIFGDEDREPGEWGHWTGRGMNWNSMCAACHNTRVRKNYNLTTDTYETAMAEPTVSCGACHGPMADHVAWQRKNRGSNQRDPTLRQFDRTQVFETCGSCHARRTDLTGDFHPGENFLDHYGLVIPDETDVYYPDGQVRDENFEYAAFLGSRMHAAGVRCTDCHLPHSAKTRLTGDALCMQCHDGRSDFGVRIDPATHTFHAPGTAGSRCVDCHMPLTTYMERHPRHDHGFTIPDPLLTLQFGIPNACNRCHSDRSADWALETVDQWYGARMERTSRQRAQIIARAREGDRTAMEELRQIAEKDAIPYWRASAAGLLRQWIDAPEVQHTLSECAKDSDPLVRGFAVRSLEPAASAGLSSARRVLEQLLDDPIRAVRVEAGWALRTTLDTNSLAGIDFIRHLDYNSDQPSGLLQQGTFHLDRGDVESALKLFQRAVSWDEQSAPIRLAYAVALSMTGQSAKAVEQLEAATRIAPREAQYHYRLALGLNEIGRLKEAISALEAAVRLDPQFSRAWYNLGLAYSGANRPQEALEALSQAERHNPESAEIPYARATILARLGKTEEARIAAMRALELNPNFQDAAMLLRMLSR